MSLGKRGCRGNESRIPLVYPSNEREAAVADPTHMRAQAQRWRRDATAHATDVAKALRDAADLLDEQAEVILQARATTGARAPDRPRGGPRVTP